MKKTILTTVSATIVIVFFTVSIFLNTILGLFNLAAISLESLTKFHGLQHTNKELNSKNTKLTNSNKMQTKKINTIKKRHKAKSLNTSKRFAVRSGKKIASSAIAAGTIGTAGVILIVAGLEVSDYCEDKEELLNDKNILFDTNEKFDSGTCLKEAKRDSEEIIISVKKSSSELVENSWEDTKNFTTYQWQEVTKKSDKALQEIKGFSKEQWQNIEISTDYILGKIRYEYLNF